MPYQGFFKPNNPEKYQGNVKNIIFRSGWELKFMKYCDRHDDIVEWSSEERFVSYFSQVDKRFRRYFPDFVIKTKDGRIKMIEIKPYKQTLEAYGRKNCYRKSQ